MLAAASSRLLELANRGENSFAAELLRRLAEVGREGIAVEVDDTASDRTGTVDHASSPAKNFADAKRMRDAIDVALALLDEIFELAPREPAGRRERHRRDIPRDLRDRGAWRECGQEGDRGMKKRRRPICPTFLAAKQ
ncbi:MAG: hypothetical protein EOS18_04405 [Mesorhizobium sp.]|nr:MAG: hypothetical protein EOS18_04405 [Mesorhizobium sp.]